MFSFSLTYGLKNMDMTELKALSAANSRLPSNAFFAYQGIEVIEFNFFLRVGIELVNGKTLCGNAINPRAFTLKFDDSTDNAFKN
ncbi:hypothetical protein [Alteromonas gracilis]|uniref:hypothetical protein n=1 Tax=Alteromonas gracilis TaxID=1479524 RepID=UPI00373540C3